MRKSQYQFVERFCVATERDRTSKTTEVQALAQAVRPASLAASARLSLFVAERTEVNAVPLITGPEKTLSRLSEFGIQGLQERMQAQRSSARPNTGGCAATSFARGGSFGLFAGCATQRTMRARGVPSAARSNPSINRTRNGGPRSLASVAPVAPLRAGYLKR